MRKHFYLFVFLIMTGFCFSQLETSKWYFGNNAGVDFSTNPPTTFTNGLLSAPFGCASIASANGSLLFYTDGATVWNQNQAVMANGTLLSGTNSAQSSVIVKKPGSNTLYY